MGCLYLVCLFCGGFLGGLVIGSCLGIDLVWFLTVVVGFCRLCWFGWRIVWFRYIVGGSLC